MKSKYQIFISSTYKDLINERQQILALILQNGHIPVGMEFFPASNDDPLSLIKKIIKECDYYIVVTSDRYGSKNSSGVSFTELEYDYAREMNIPVLAFIRSNTSNLPPEKKDSDINDILSLEKFREKLTKNHTCAYWEENSLNSKISTALHNEIEKTPRPGWIRPTSTNHNEPIKNKNINDEFDRALKIIADCEDNPLTKRIVWEWANKLNFNKLRSKHYIAKFCKRKLIEVSNNNDHRLILTSKGIEYIIDNDLDRM